MKRYDIRVRYSFEGTYTVAAEDRDEAKRMVNDDCGLVLGGDIHTTRDDDEVLEWDFCIHPDTRILSLQERGGKGSLPSEAVEKKMRETCGGGICSMDDWIDNQEACMLMNVSPRKLLQLRRSRIIPYSHIDRKVYYRRQDIIRYLENSIHHVTPESL